MGKAGLSHSSEMRQGAGMADDLTLSSGSGKEPRAQAGLVGPAWQDKHIPSLAAHRQGVSVRPKGLPLGFLRPCIAGTLNPCPTGEAAGRGADQKWRTESCSLPLGCVTWDKHFQLPEP